MASASPCPARSLERGHPLRLPLLLHLRLHPHRHLPPPGRLSCGWGDQAHPGQGAHGLRSHGARGYEAAILSHDGPKKMFGFLSPSRSAIGVKVRKISMHWCKLVLRRELLTFADLLEDKNPNIFLGPSWDNIAASYPRAP